MARVKRAMNARKYHKKVLKLAKGYYGGKSKLFKTANETVIRALRNAYVGRKLKKRDFRSLWIARINAATRMNGLSYSRFMNGIKLAGININRKMLSEIAINDPKAFADLVEVAKKNLNA
ncbi:50S ribosomal protein L20 [Clostridium swellfunianum]|uniref:50S ribosomal protein L20 n=1 Tax=Clostridium swellfunianum TaxID=1367462 RepID=UPI00202E350E|nr:50S ribosomal protein L20 [Clostridium swellfunianum]MCM0650613.1 50S ribosomal protein L20 [Clostridium swellfunianum]